MTALASLPPFNSDTRHNSFLARVYATYLIFSSSSPPLFNVSSSIQTRSASNPFALWTVEHITLAAPASPPPQASRTGPRGLA